jgi:hypothetical protein
MLFKKGMTTKLLPQESATISLFKKYLFAADVNFKRDMVRWCWESD